MPGYGLDPYGLDPYGLGLPDVAGMPAKHAGLSVWVDGIGMVTSQVSGLVVKNGSPGGFLSVEFDLPRRLDQSRLPDKVSVRVYDQTTGEQVGGGRIVEQGLTDSGLWRIAALGEGIAAMQDRDEPYMVIDRELAPAARPEAVGVTTKRMGRAGSKRKRRKNSVSAYVNQPVRTLRTIVMAEAKTGSAPNGSTAEGILYEIAPGVEVATGGQIFAHFHGPRRCGQTLGAYGFRFVANDAWAINMRAISSSAGGSETDVDTALSDTESAMTWRGYGTDFSASRDAVALGIVRTGANVTIPESGFWAHVRKLVIRSQILRADGQPYTAAQHQTEYVYAHSIFYDLINRRCPGLRVVANATGTTKHYQATWYDGATPKEIIDELLESESIAYHAWEADPDGVIPISLDPMPTTVRYEIDVKDGFSAPTPSTDIYDKVTVTGFDADGFPRRITVSRNTDGLPRSTTLPMAGMWDSGDATAAAEAFLDAHAAPPNAGTLTVARRVRDVITGRYVHPAAIRSGELCRVRGVQPTPDTLNPEAKQDGVTIFRIVSNTYSADSGMASLELDTNVVDSDRMIADLIG